MEERIDELIMRIVDCLYQQASDGLDHVDTDEFGKVADILKDLAYAKSLMK